MFGTAKKHHVLCLDFIHRLHALVIRCRVVELTVERELERLPGNCLLQLQRRASLTLDRLRDIHYKIKLDMAYSVEGIGAVVRTTAESDGVKWGRYSSLICVISVGTPDRKGVRP